jgi:hypothetical protein
LSTQPIDTGEGISAAYLFAAMNATRVSVIVGLIGLAANVESAAQTLTIAPAVEVEFDSVTNHFYQVEKASRIAPEEWTPVGPVHFGKGRPLTQSVTTTLAEELFFRTREYNFTNGLLTRFPLDAGATRNPSGLNYVRCSYLMANRFETPDHAGQNRADTSLDPRMFAMLSNYAQQTNDFTISLWIYGIMDTQPSRAGHILSIDTRLIVTATNGTIRLEVAIQASAANAVVISQPTSWESNRWYCIQVIRAANQYLVYRDGELVGHGSNPKSAVPFHDYFTVWMGPQPGGADDAWFFERALTQDDARALMRMAEH